MKEEDSLDFDALLKNAFFVLNSDAEKALKLFFDLHDRQEGDQGKVLFGIAVSMGKLNLFAKAIPFLEKAVSIQPKNSIYIANLGLYLKALGRYSEAIIYLKKSISLNDRFVQAYQNLGLCNLEIKDVSGAIEAFKKTVELDPKNFQHLKNLSQAYIYSKQWEFARNILIKIAPDFLICRLKLADVCLEMNLYDEANRELEEIINYKTEKINELDIKALALIRLDRYQEAYDLLSDNERFPVVQFARQKEFTSAELFNLNYKKLPKITVIKKSFSNTKKMIIYSAADVTYAASYIEGFVESLQATNPKVISHFHIMGENNEAIQTFISDYGKIISNKNVSMSFEIAPDLNRALCISRRLCRTLQILKLFKLPVFQVDIDCLFLKDLTTVLDLQNLSHIALYERPNEVSINQLILASFCYFSYTDKALNFLRFVTNYLCYLEFEEKKVKWFCDQVALLAARRWFRETYNNDWFTNLNDKHSYLQNGSIFDAIRHFKGVSKQQLT